MPLEGAGELEAVPGHRDYLSVIFRRCVLALIGAGVPEDTVMDKHMLEHFVNVAEQYFTDLIRYLHRLTAMQRRSSPALSDLALMLHFSQLNVLDLVAEMERTPLLEDSKPIATLNALYFDPEEASLDALQVPFFEKPRQLVKSTQELPQHIPSWMPSLPPEHTYMHTSSHFSQIRDLRSVRMSLVEEGSLAERALQRLLGDRGSSSMIELPKEPKEQPRTNTMVVVDTQPPEPQEEAKKAAPPQRLKLQLHLPKPEPAPGKLSLKLSLGKKKRRDSILGKRPRVDIEKLAHQRTRGQEEHEMEVDETKEPQPQNDDLPSLFNAALASYVK